MFFQYSLIYKYTNNLVYISIIKQKNTGDNKQKTRKSLTTILILINLKNFNILLKLQWHLYKIMFFLQFIKKQLTICGVFKF